MLMLNVTTAYLLSRTVISKMTAQRSGRIIDIAAREGDLTEQQCRGYVLYLTGSAFDHGLAERDRFITYSAIMSHSSLVSSDERRAGASKASEASKKSDTSFRTAMSSMVADLPLWCGRMGSHTLRASTWASQAFQNLRDRMKTETLVAFLWRRGDAGI